VTTATLITATRKQKKKQDKDYTVQAKVKRNSTGTQQSPQLLKNNDLN